MFWGGLQNEKAENGDPGWMGGLGEARVSVAPAAAGLQRAFQTQGGSSGTAILRESAPAWAASPLADEHSPTPACGCGSRSFIAHTLELLCNERK